MDASIILKKYIILPIEEVDLTNTLESGTDLPSTYGMRLTENVYRELGIFRRN